LLISVSRETSAQATAVVRFFQENPVPQAIGGARDWNEARRGAAATTLSLIKSSDCAKAHGVGSGGVTVGVGIAGGDRRIARMLNRRDPGRVAGQFIRVDVSERHDELQRQRKQREPTTPPRA
jgi:hypothetical protein